MSESKKECKETNPQEQPRKFYIETVRHVGQDTATKMAGNLPPEPPPLNPKPVKKDEK